jgi:hypothetical protein
MTTPFPRTGVTMGVSYGGSPMMIKTPIGVVALVEALGAVGFSRLAKNRCSGKQGRVQELEDPFW